MILHELFHTYEMNFFVSKNSCWKEKNIYTTKIMESVSVCVCVYVCPAMRFVMLRGMELKLNMGVGDRSTRFVGIFSEWPHPGSKVIQRSICLRNALWLPNLVRRTPEQSVVHCWGQWSSRGQLGSTRGQFALKCPMATKVKYTPRGRI